MSSKQKKHIRILVIVYLLTFAMNFIFAAVDLSVLYLPTSYSANRVWHDGIPYRYTAYRKGLALYLKQEVIGSDREYEIVPINLSEYKACINELDIDTIKKEEVEFGRGAGTRSEYIRIKYPFQDEREFCLDSSMHTGEIMHLLYDAKTSDKDSSLCLAVINLIGEYDIKNAVFCMDFCKDDREIFGNHIYYNRLETYARNTYYWENEYWCRMDEDNISNLYLGTNIDTIRKLAYDFGCRYYIYGDDYPYYLLHQDDDEYSIPAPAVAFMKLRYFDHIPTTRGMAYSNTFTENSTSLFIYYGPEANAGYELIFMTDSKLTRELIISNAKLIFASDGHIPVFKGMNKLCHILLIYAIETPLFALAVIAVSLKSSKKKEQI